MKKCTSIAAVSLFCLGFFTQQASAGLFDDLKKIKEKAVEIKNVVKESAQEIKNTQEEISKIAPEQSPADEPEQQPAPAVPTNTKPAAVASSAPATKKSTSASVASSTSTASKPATASAVSSSSGYRFITEPNRNGFGQFKPLNADGSRFTSNNANEPIFKAQEQLARIYLHYFPDAAMGDESTVLQFAQIFYPDELRAFNQARLNAFDRRKKIHEWEGRLKSVKSAKPGSITVYMPLPFSQNYAFDKQAFPANLRIGNVVSLTSGVPGLNCIEVDKSFSLSQLSIPEGQAEAFMQRNVADRRSASIFISYTFVINGRQGENGNPESKCPLVGKLLAVDGYEYRGKEKNNYAAFSAEIGPKFRSWMDNPGDEVKLETAYKYRQVADSAPAEAKQFNLLSQDGLLLYSPSQGSVSSLPQEANNALRKYVDFIQIELNPAFYEHQALCYARNYLPEKEKGNYLGGTMNRWNNWKGDTPFEQDASKAAFLQGPGSAFRRQAVSMPQQYLLLSREILDNYDKENEGFWLHNLVGAMQIKQLQGNCGSVSVQPPADFVDLFWAISPTDADALMNSLDKPGGHYSFNQEVLRRQMFTRVEVEVTAIEAGMPQVPENYGLPPFPPLQLNIRSVDLYADEALTRKIRTLKVHQPPKPVLLTGIPKAPVAMEYFEVTARNRGMWAMMAKAPISDSTMSDLLVDLMKSDTAYYSQFDAYQQQRGKNTALPEIPAGYIPFYPKAYHGDLKYVSDTHRELAKNWLEKNIERLPKNLTLKTILRYDTRKGKETVDLQLKGFAALPQALLDAGLSPESTFFPPEDRNYGRSFPRIEINDKQYQLVYAADKPLNAYVPKLSVPAVFKEEQGWNPYYGSLESDFNFTVKRVALVNGEGNADYLVAYIRPTSLKSYHFSNGTVAYRQSY